VDFIFGLPEETEKDIMLTLELIGKLTDMGSRIHSHYFMPLPGTVFAKKKPVKISNELRNKIKYLTGKGLAYGNWEQQELFTNKINKEERDF